MLLEAPSFLCFKEWANKAHVQFEIVDTNEKQFLEIKAS